MVDHHRPDPAHHWHRRCALICQGCLCLSDRSPPSCVLQWAVTSPALSSHSSQTPLPSSQAISSLGPCPSSQCRSLQMSFARVSLLLFSPSNVFPICSPIISGALLGDTLHLKRPGRGDLRPIPPLPTRFFLVPRPFRVRTAVYRPSSFSHPYVPFPSPSAVRHPGLLSSQFCLPFPPSPLSLPSSVARLLVPNRRRGLPNAR